RGWCTRRNRRDAHVHWFLHVRTGHVELAAAIAAYVGALPKRLGGQGIAAPLLCACLLKEVRPTATWNKTRLVGRTSSDQQWVSEPVSVRASQVPTSQRASAAPWLAASLAPAQGAALPAPVREQASAQLVASARVRASVRL